MPKPERYLRVHAESSLGLRFRCENDHRSSAFVDRQFHGYTLVGADPIYPRCVILRRRSWVERLLGVG